MDAPRDGSTSSSPVLEAPAEQHAPRTRLRPLWLVGGAVLLLAALLRPQQLLTTLTSPRALLALLGVVLMTVLLRRACRALPTPVATVVTALPGLLALLLLVVPLVRTTSVDEDLDGLAELPAASTGAGAGAGAEQPVAGVGAPVRVATAAVQGIGHRASGSASLVRLPDGALVVRLEDLEVDPGPDYRLVLVPGTGQESPGDEGLDLGPLKATSGNQNYAVEQPPPDQPFTVLVWCRAFSVPIAGATLGPDRHGPPHGSPDQTQLTRHGLSRHA